MGTLGCILWFAGLGIVGARYWRARIQRWREGMSGPALQGYTAVAAMATFSTLLWVVMGGTALGRASWVAQLIAAAAAWVLFICLAEWWKRTPSFSTTPSEAESRLRDQDMAAAGIKQALLADQHKLPAGPTAAPPPGVPMAQSSGPSAAQSGAPPVAQPAPRHAAGAPAATYATVPHGPPQHAPPLHAPRPDEAQPAPETYTRTKQQRREPLPPTAPAGPGLGRDALVRALERHAEKEQTEEPMAAAPSNIATLAEPAAPAPEAAAPPSAEAAPPTSEPFTYQPQLIESRFGKKG